MGARAEACTSLNPVIEEGELHVELDTDTSFRPPERARFPPALASRASSTCSLLSDSAASSVAPTAFDALRRYSEEADAPRGGTADGALLADFLAEMAVLNAPQPSDWSSLPSSPAASEASVLLGGFAVARGVKG